MKKSVFLMIALLWTVAQGAWAGASVTTVTTEEELRTAVQTNGANVLLEADIQLSQYLDINNQVHVTIDLNGYKLSRSLTEYDRAGHVIWVHGNSELTLKSSNGSGIIEGGRAYNGGAIHIPNGNTVSATNVIFQDNSAADHAGAIWNNGTFTATDCTFTNNTANDVGAIYNSITDNGCGSATLTNCTITENTGTNGAGALGNALGATEMVIEGGTIQNNIACTNGGGIWNGGTLRMQGAVTVTGNMRINHDPSNVFLKNEKVITVTGSLSGSSIGVELEDGSGVITSGFNTNHHNDEVSDFFTPDYSFTFNVARYNGEASLVEKDGGTVYYFERSWNDASQQVVSTVLNVDQYLTVTSSTSTLGTGSNNAEFYVVSGEVNRGTIEVNGKDVHLILLNDSKLTITSGGLRLEGDNKLSIHCQSYSSHMGQLIVSQVSDKDNLNAAGIGSAQVGGNERSVGELVIHGGHIEAKGGQHGAGIGSCARIQGNTSKRCNKVTVYGGYVQATGGYYAAGIGGGAGYGSRGIDGGEFTLYDGKVIATGSRYASGLGGGGSITTSSHHNDYKGNGGNGGTVNIYGGELIATGDEKGAGIGSGNFGIPESAAGRNGGTVNIYGGKVTATGGESAAGIGGGYNCKGGDVTITGGIVIAKAGEQGGVQNRAIGPGQKNDDYGTLTIGREMMVGAGNNGGVERIVDADEREDACWYRSYAEISPCTHPGATYTVNGTDANNTHTMLCGHCTTAFNADPHEFDENGECSVCHYKGEAYTVIIYLPDAKDDDTYETDGAYKPYAYGIVAGTVFTLPGAPQDLYDMDFAGWLVTTDEFPSFSTYKASADEALLVESTEYTPNCDVSFVARYKDIAVNLADNSDNAETLYNYDGRKAASVTLEGRTLYRDGKWNTLCLPFYLADGDTDPGHSPVVGGIDGKTFTGTQLEGAEVMGYDHAEFDSRSGTLELIFGPLFTVPAGEPFLIRWSKSGLENLVNPVFTGVTIDNSTSAQERMINSWNYVDFVGTFAPIDIFTEDKTTLYLGEGNQLFYPSGENMTSFTLNAFRAYFQLKDGLTAGQPTSPEQPIKAFVLNFGDEETGIEEISESSEYSETSEYSDYYFTLDGRKLDGQPTQKGMYIHGGRKVLIK